MATFKKVFTLRLQEEIFEKIDTLAKQEHRSTTNLIEFILLNHIEKHKAKNGEILFEEKEI